MTVKERVKLSVFLLVFMVISCGAFAVNTTAIDAVLEKVKADSASFSGTDAAVVDEFLVSALGELLTAKNFWEAVDLRGVIVVRQGDKSMGQYRAEFLSSARKHLQFAFEEVLRSGNDENKLRAARTLIVMVGLLKDVSLSEFGITLAEHPDSTIRYWAVKSIANPTIAAQLKSVTPEVVQIAEKIVSGLENVIGKEQYPEILSQVVTFAGDLGGRLGKRLILKIADRRIKSYADWSVEYELMDGQVLAELGRMILAENPGQDRVSLCRRFGQLYSYVIQRYVLGKDVLNETQQEQLVSVMVEVEQSVVSKLLGEPHANMKKWIERKSYVALKSEHKTLLGDSSQAGELAAKMNFDYGNDSDGRAITAPLELQAPPGGTDEAAQTEEGE